MKNPNAVFLFLFALFFMSCNKNDLAQLANAIQSGTASATATSTGTDSTEKSNSCFYTVSITYDLGPELDVTEDFFSTHVDVIQKVTARNSNNCPREITIPVLGAWRTGTVDEIERQHNSVMIHPTWRTTTTLDIDSSSSLLGDWSVSLTKKVKQVSNGVETQIFNSGSMTSSDSTTSNAKMVLSISYYYTSTSSSSSGSNDGWMTN